MEGREEQLVVINFGADTPEPGTYGTELRTPECLQSPTTNKTPNEHDEPLEVTAEPLPAGNAEAMYKKGRGKDKAEKQRLIPLYTLFRFATCFDLLMILVGTILGIAAGVAIPAHFLLFGQVINQFVYYEQALIFQPIVLNQSQMMGLECEPFRDMVINGTIDLMGPPNPMATVADAATNNSDLFFCQQTSLFSNILNLVCDPEAVFIDEINTFSLIYLGLGLGVLLTALIANLFWNISAYRQTRRMRAAFYRSILRQEIGWFDVTQTAELSTRLSDDIEKIQAGIGDKVAVFLEHFTSFLCAYAIAFTYNWKLALVVSSTLPCMAILGGVIAKLIASFTVRESNAYAAAGAVAEEVLGSIRTVVAFGGEQKEVERYGEHLKKATNEGIKKGLTTSIVLGALYFVIFCAFALGFWFGSTLIIDCELPAGDVVSVFFTVMVGNITLGNALPDLETFATALGSATAVFKIIDREPVIDSSSDEGEIPDNLEGNIEFSDVIFHYPARPNVQVLKGLSLKISKGQTVALVGSSGCGKSTTVQLLQRFYNPDAGLITIDGKDIKNLNLKWLRQNIGVVSQEPVLFNTTIAENIRFGREDATMEDIERAAKNANAYNFISQFPDGFNTHVGERGAQMSGGQKQRIAIARALVRDPKILLLDEATSALDTESERVVQDALDKAREGRTTIVIAHRLSTIQTADIIVSIDDGRVVEMGDHLKLMDNEGLYFELVTAQTIVEPQQESTRGGNLVDPMTSFRTAVKRSVSSRGRLQNTFSTTSRRPSSFSTRSLRQTNRPSYFHQASTHPNRAAAALTSKLSRFSWKEPPVAAHPSPLPARVGFLTGADAVYNDNDDDDEGELSEEEKAYRVVTSDMEEGEVSKFKWGWSKHQRKLQAEGIQEVPFRELIKLNLPDWHFILAGIICSAIIGALFPTLSILFSEILRVYGQTDVEVIERDVRRLTLGFLGLAVGAALSYFTAVFTLAIAGERLTKRMRYQTFKAMLRQNIGWFDNHANTTGALATRLAVDASEVKGATGIRLGILLQTICGFIAGIVISLIANWKLTLVLVFIFPLLTTESYLQLKFVAGRSAKNKKRQEASGQTAVESIENIRTVAGLGAEDILCDKYEHLLKGPFKASVKSVFFSALAYAFATSMIFYLLSAGYRFGAFLVIEDGESYDDIFRVFAAMIFAAWQAGRASSFAPDVSKAKISAARIFDLLRLEPSIDTESPDGLKLGSSTGEVSVENVHFHYPSRPKEKVLQGLTVSVKPGQTLALVGPSGCGKSTIVSLIQRFYDPLLGTLSVDGNPVNTLNIKWLRSQIGIVSQEPVLFDATIADNIRYGANFREVSDEEVIEAAKAANIHNFIGSLPQGYNTNTGSKGTQLSGGQKQRIAIARALVRDPKILLLDEATSALDTESEKIVQEALDKARDGRTSIVIAHRLSTIYKADCIAVIHNGEVIESGTHAELMAKRGAYYHLNTVQLEDVE